MVAETSWILVGLTVRLGEMCMQTGPSLSVIMSGLSMTLGVMVSAVHMVKDFMNSPCLVKCLLKVVSLLQRKPYRLRWNHRS